MTQSSLTTTTTMGIFMPPEAPVSIEGGILTIPRGNESIAAICVESRREDYVPVVQCVGRYELTQIHPITVPAKEAVFTAAFLVLGVFFLTRYVYTRGKR